MCNDPFGGLDAGSEIALLTWGNENRYRLIEGYKTAADHLVDHALNEGTQNHLVYPILFLYRHFLELSIKSAIETVKEYLRQSEQLMADFKAPDMAKKVNQQTYGHNLVKAWNDLESTFAKLDVRPNADDITRAYATIHRFTDLDPRADAFRYSDSSTDAKIRDFDQINLTHLKTVVKDAGDAIGGIDAWLEDQVEVGKQILGSSY